jgi:trehalose synthase-fused probable maltokinase
MYAASTNQAPVARAIASITSDELLAFLTAQRWFGAKGGSPTNGRVSDFVVLPWGDGTFAIARAVVDVSGERQSYQLTLAARDDMPDGVSAKATIKPGLYDATYDPAFREGLAHALSNGATSHTGDATWHAKPVTALTLTTDSKVGSAEQSNTSIIFGDAAIVKLFRSLKAGVHPDVEVTDFLTTRLEFANTPKLLATLTYEHDGMRYVAGMAQQFMPGSTDAWTYALERGKKYFEAPIDRDEPNLFVDDARKLGAVTRAMHEALAADDDHLAFAPDAVTPEDVDTWAHRAQQSIREALTLLAAQLGKKALPAERVPEATALVNRRDHFLGWIDEIDDNIGDDLGLCTRVHGDFHLGQVLRTASGDFMIIDFEGEPSRSISDRREKTSPLRDVAGMLRSFAYAAATLATSTKNIDPRTREVRIARWERDVRTAYLDGYLKTADEDAAEILPEDKAHTNQLIALFEAEKAFYELSYELNNRPTWAWIPMRGISKLFVAR